MDTQAMKQAIKEALESTGAENVFVVVPRTEDLQDIINKMLQADKKYLQYWIVQTAPKRSDTSDTLSGFVPIGCTVRWSHAFIITLNIGYLEGRGDIVDSQIHFENIIDRTLTQLAGNRRYGGVAWNSFRPMELVAIGTGSLGGQFLTHEATMQLILIEHQDVVFS